MALANVTLTNTFDDWRTRTNQILVQGEQTFGVANGAFNKVNVVNVYATSIALSTNSYALATATSIGTSGNNYAIAIGAAGNSRAVAIGTSGNTYALATATSIGTSGNTYALATATSIGTSGNNYAIAIGAAGNSRAVAIGTSGNTYALATATSIGVSGNSYTNAVGQSGNSFASVATNLTSGTVPSARMSGSYTGITGVGTITTGVWNGTDIAVADGGTGASDATTARTNLGLGTMATQASSSVSISGGSISGLSSLGVSGAITATGDITAFSSDARLKGDVQTITDALSKVNLITGITYKHNDLAKSFGYTDENRFAGVLAQEVEAVLPEVVVPAPFDVADDGTSKSGENYKTVKYEKIVPLLIEAIKELTAKVEILESKAGK